jgi:hypothetical protein
MSLDDKTDSESIIKIDKHGYDSGSLKLTRESYGDIRNGILRGYEYITDALRNFEEGICQRLFNILLR